MATKPTRAWQEISGSITVPELDENNLPVEEIDITSLAFQDILPNLYPDATGAAMPVTDRYGENISTEPYDKFSAGAPMPFYSDEYMKGENQTNFGKFVNGLASRSLSIIPKIGQSTAHVAGTIGYAMQYLQDPETADPSIIWDNAVANLMQEIDRDFLPELFPIHSRKKYAEGNLLEQMGTMEFWANDFFDGLAFAAQAYAPGAAMGAIGKAMKLAPKALKGFQIYGSTIWNTAGEAGFESKDYGDGMRSEKAYQQYGRDFNKLTIGEQQPIKDAVAPFQANVFKANAATLALSNFVQSRFFFGPLGDNAQKIRRGVATGALKVEDVHAFRNARRALLKGAAVEGLWE